MQDISKKHKILVVEDEANIRQVLCFFLSHSGFDVLDVSDGQEAIEVIPKYCPDLIVLDLLMQPVSGWDVLHWLRTVHLNPSLPVLVLTALVHLTEQVQGFEEGAVDYLTKPAQPSRVVERVRTILSLTAEQRLLLQKKRIDEQRRTLERVSTPQIDEFAY